MAQEKFTRQEVIILIDELLKRPDLLIDAVTENVNDNTAEPLLDIAINGLKNSEARIKRLEYLYWDY